MRTHERIRRRVSNVVVVSLLTPLIAAAATDNGTITVGSMDGGTCNGSTRLDWGYISGIMGGYSPTGLTGGKTVKFIFNTFMFPPRVGCSNIGSLAVSGFSSNPGGSWLTSITCNSVTWTGAASTFTYTASTGTAQW